VTDPPKNLAEALSQLQGELKPIKRKSKGQSGSREHRYAGRDAVSVEVYPLLAKYGLSFSGKPTLNDAGEFVLAYVLRHVSGESDAGEWPLNAGLNSQGRGSEITYALRYCLQAITGATPEGEDDDGAEAVSQAPAGRQRRPVKTAQQDRQHAGLVRAVNERERPAERAQGPVPDDENLWQDQPPPPGRDAKGKIPAIQMHFERLLGKDHDRSVRLGYVAALTGHAVTTTSDLTPDEQAQLLTLLGKCKNHDALEAARKHAADAGQEAAT